MPQGGTSRGRRSRDKGGREKGPSKAEDTNAVQFHERKIPSGSLAHNPKWGLGSLPSEGG